MRPFSKAGILPALFVACAGSLTSILITAFTMEIEAYFAVLVFLAVGGLLFGMWLGGAKDPQGAPSPSPLKRLRLLSWPYFCSTQ
jgi:hypothetical protein